LLRNFIEELEKIIHQALCAEGQKIMRETLMNIDQELQKTRNKTIYRHKGRTKTTLKTVFGNVAFQKTVYKDTINGKTICLTDKLFKNCVGLFSAHMAKTIATLATSNTYRETARIISEITGETISPQTAWDVTQEMGSRSIKDIRISAAKAEAIQAGDQPDTEPGKITTQILYQEMDGIYLHLQKESRKGNKKGKEMKVGIAYAGTVKIGKRKISAHKVTHASFEPVKEFKRNLEGVIAKKFVVDEIKTRIISGDGAPWIKTYNDDEAFYQLDKYHRNRAITQSIANKDIQKNIFALLKNGKKDEALMCVDQLIENPEKENTILLRALRDYLEQNRPGLTPVTRSLLPPTNKGLDHSRCGTMESNVFTIIGNRMKGGRACWSINGANNLASLLARKHSSVEMFDFIERTASMPTKKTTEKQFSANAIQKRIGKGYEAKQGSTTLWIKKRIRSILA
jgi:hypothetical protein